MTTPLPCPVEVWSHDQWWPGRLEDWQQVGGAWWGLVAYEIAPVLADHRGREHVIREVRRMWQHQWTFRPRTHESPAVLPGEGQNGGA